MTGNEKVKQKSLDFDSFHVEPHVQVDAYNKWNNELLAKLNENDSSQNYL